MRFNLENVKTPWLSSYGEVPFHLEYSDKSMSGAVLETIAKDPDFTALSFMGRSISYRELGQEIDRTARAFYALGVRPGNRVLVCLPNVPQAIYCLYGLNRIGAVATMVHPLSAVAEIAFYLKQVPGSKAAESFWKAHHYPRVPGTSFPAFPGAEASDGKKVPEGGGTGRRTALEKLH